MNPSKVKKAAENTGATANIPVCVCVCGVGGWIDANRAESGF